MSFSLSVIIPAYNEENSISQTLDTIVSFLANQNFDFEVIVVDDGSIDNTNDLINRRNDIQLITLEKNRGKGFAVKTGVLKSQKEFILFMDADHAIPINYITRFKKEITNYDIIIGSKYLDQNEHYPFYRKFVGKVFSKLKYIITGLKIKDTQCGFKLFKKEVGKDLFSLSQITGWCFDVEILLLAQKKSFKIKEFPIKLSDINAQSNISILNSGSQMFMDLLKLRIKFKRGDYNL
tara:strand:- start:397 stop:1104 length:708 start_codon:yes stop_codon:yes gene_type:complete